jgi:hypothetical protein
VFLSSLLWYHADMSDKLPYFPEDETEPLPVGEWFDELSWSPSQCYCRIQHDGIDYMLYLRWRWTDPWQAYIVKNAASLAAMNRVEVVWSGDVFEQHQIHYDDVELEFAKDKMISLFYELDGNFSQLRLLQHTM